MTQKEKTILQSIDEKLDKVCVILFGNGEEGLCEKVRNLEKTKKTFLGLPIKVKDFLEMVLAGAMIYLILKG